ncbi:MAG: tetratricopeptide repeat protein [Ruminococcus sp.]
MRENRPDIATSYNNVGCAYVELGEHKKALEYYQRLLSIQNDTLL